MHPEIDRIYFMDSMRSVLMALGIVTHSALIFSPQLSWVIHTPEAHTIAYVIVRSIHLFRMPAFFVISGFFCILTLTKYKPSIFFKVKMIRITIPLIVTALTLNSLQIYILTLTGWYSFDISTYIISGKYISHLWFLVNLAIYFSVVAFLSIFSNQIKALTSGAITKLTNFPTFAIILTLPIFSIALYSTNKLGFPLYSNFLNIFHTADIILFLPYFIFGTILGAKKELINKFSTANPAISITLMLLAWLIDSNYQSNNRFIDKIVMIYIENLETWLSISLYFFCFKCFFNKKSKLWSFMSDASYTIYLFHHIIVIIVGIFIIRNGIQIYAGFPLAMSTSLVATLLIHKYIIIKFKILRFLFNGRETNIISP